ncbi:MAG TPA: DUF817 domain-containing protein [Candidatus Saccharimonadales bacterium]|nr:DUF817 domain-containing protein [Candidatus Saccharimonadales bacterium]
MKFTKHQFLQKVRQLPAGPLLAFAIRQGWAALFGGLMLSSIIFTHYVDLPLLARYDWLFLFAIAIQVFMLLSKLEKPHEVITIILFHLVGLGMELFKTSHSVGSWSYPGDAFFKVGNVPLFSGFMYAAIGSYIARAWRVLNLSFSNYPPRKYTVLLALLIYGNFFLDHFGVDLRYLLFVALVVLYGKVTVTYSVNLKKRQMPLVSGFMLIALFIWIGENLGTYSHAWLYPAQLQHWHIVGIQKIGSWLLLMVISFIMVDMLYFIRARHHA